MSFFLEGNIYADQSFVTNSSIGNSLIVKSAISTSSIDMMSTAGTYQNITNAAMPVNPHDVAIKLYVDSLGISISNVTLTNTQGTTISSANSGMFCVLVTNLVMDGPCASFEIAKNSPSVCGHVIRKTLSPGITTNTTLNIVWPSNSGPQLYKSDINYDGSYQIKFF